MKLYEVNEEIMKVLCILDEEGGEINDTTTAAMEKLDSLQMEKTRILEYLAKVVLNIRAEQAAIKDEELRLKARRMRLESKEEKLINILDRECDGEKTDFGIATLSYRKSESLEVVDNTKAIEWLYANGHDDCVRVHAPEVAKDMVKKLIKTNVDVPGVQISLKNNPSLK